MKSLRVIVIVSVFLSSTFVANADTVSVQPTEITSAPVQFLAASATILAMLDVSEGCTLINRRLKLRDNNNEVLALGNFLKNKKYFSGKPSKKFTSALEKALIKYQTDNSLLNEGAENLGVVTVATREKIATDSCKKKDLEAPKTSCVFLTRNLNRQNNDERFIDDNKSLQRFLVQKGYLSSTFVTGDFGSLTREAVLRFQLDNGIISSSAAEGAGEVGPKTRGFIVSNTCGKADVEKTDVATLVGYNVSTTARTGVNITSTESTQILKLAVKPKEQNAKLKSLVVQIDSAVEANLSSIASVELYSGSNKLISRTTSGAKVSGVSHGYKFTLSGADTALERNENSDLNVRVVAKAGSFASTTKDFKLFVPVDGLSLEFSNANGVAKGTETWPRATSSSQQSTFSFRVASSATASSTVNTNTASSTVNNANTNAGATPTAAVDTTPQLNRIIPAQGSFGDMMVLRGKNFAASGNKVVLVHGPTGASTTMSGYASKNGEITFQFPQKGREFVRPNGKKISGELGNYRISVVSNGVQSNHDVFKILK